MESKGKGVKEGSPESPYKMWGEEKAEDVVYSVYLKKVSYKAADDSCALNDSCQANLQFLSYLQWETLRIKTIKAASVRKLVEHLPVAVEEMDSVYINVFFSTYQTFTNLREALDILISRYMDIQATATEAEKDQHQKNIRSVLMMWLDEGQDDFREGPDYTCLHTIEEFARDVMQDVELQLRAQLMIQSFTAEASPKAETIPEKPKSQFSVNDEVDFMMLGTVGFQEIREIDSRLLAEQLTLIEAELFRKVIPQHCLGSIWSRRDKKRGVDPVTVIATVNQFNDITMKVMSTILEDRALRPLVRASIITKWIEVAQTCRELKNFSSLKAIISALQSHPIYRLRRAWNMVPKSSLALYEDLASIFHDDNNFEAWREIINKEGTAKFASVSPRSSKKTTRSLKKMMSSDKLVVQRRESWHGKVNGTVPYLGTFLTDLIKIDTAFPDTVDGHLINFEKKRKEFEVVAQIKLLQMASKNYQILPNDKFLEWFNEIHVLTYQECCEQSERIETPNAMPSSAPTTPTLLKTDKPKMSRKFFSFTAEDYKHRTCPTNCNPSNTNSNSSNGHSSSDRGIPVRSRTGHGAKNHSSTSSISSTSSTPSSEDSISLASIDNHLPSSTMASTSSSTSSSSSSSSSTSTSGSTSMSMSSTSTEGSSRDSSLLSVENSPARPPRPLKASLSLACLPTLNRQSSSSCLYEFPSESCRIIRVGLDESLQQEGDGNIYRSLVISHQEHTPAVIKTAMDKHHMSSTYDCHDYELVQLLDEKELQIPDDANVFYAMNAAAQPHFLLRKKSSTEENSVPSTKKKSLRSSNQKNSKRLHIKRMSWVKVRDDSR
ncbi:ral guanine nucleotide dissociation stimulator-like 1 [Diadema setosum]|uniref:ral guanine nucleotide dissociation stimulator-like 1 n=1 Tax=Diadema setosum TaxID=31175 RepID=UPI003B3AED43